MFRTMLITTSLFFSMITASPVFACRIDSECTYPDKCYRGDNYDGICMPKNDVEQIEKQKEELEKLKKQSQPRRGLGPIGPVGPTGTLNQPSN